jgi:hypothetical protein
LDTFPDPLQNLPAIHLRHGKVKHHQIWPATIETAQTFKPIGRFRGFMASTL